MELYENAINEIDEVEEIGRNPFKITDATTGIWAFEKLKILQDKKEEVEKIAKSLIQEKTERIQRWADKEVEPLELDIEYFKALILEYYREQKAEDEKFKMTSPYGKITSRTGKKYRYDDKILLEYLQNENPEYVRIKEEINKAELKKAYPNGVDPETGELIAGMDVEIETTIDIKLEG